MADEAPTAAAPEKKSPSPSAGPEVRVRRIHRRDLNRTWEFLKLVFRAVNRETVEYQRPRSKKRFLQVYDEEGVEQLLFEVTDGDKDLVVGYAECAFEITGTDNWMNERYFEQRDMRPLFVEELAVHPDFQGQGIGGYMLEQLEHLARVRGCTHLVLEVAENNDNALKFYRARAFQKLDAAIFMAKRVQAEPELLPPRRLKKRKASEAAGARAHAAKRARRTSEKPAAPTDEGETPSGAT
jgi:ribosomal protein S18 acetylase RimI-like enzyme